MADNVAVTAGSGTTVAADEVIDATLGTVKVQYVKIMDATLDGTTKAAVGSGGLAVDLGANNDVTVTGTITEASGAAIKTAVELIDNAVSGAGFNITQLNGAAVPIGAGTEAAAVRVTLATDSTGVVSIDDNGAAITVDGTVAVTSAGITTIAGAVSGTEMQVDVLTMPSVAVTQATGTNLHTVVDSGTVTTVSTVTALTTLTGGGIAHDSADSGNPIKVGAKAFSPDGTTPGTAVAENDRSDLKTDLNGRLFVNTASPQMLHVNLNGSSAYTDQALIADPGDGFQVVITGIIGSTGAATALNFFLEEGSTKIFGPIYLEATAGRGFVSGPILLPCTASTAITLTSSAAIAQSFDVFYYLQAV